MQFVFKLQIPASGMFASTHKALNKRGRGLGNRAVHQQVETLRKRLRLNHKYERKAKQGQVNEYSGLMGSCVYFNAANVMGEAVNLPPGLLYKSIVL